MIDLRLCKLGLSRKLLLTGAGMFAMTSPFAMGQARAEASVAAPRARNAMPQNAESQLRAFDVDRKKVPLT
jgi:hypothetical protein